MKQLYGTGNYNPRFFDMHPQKKSNTFYVWAVSFFIFTIAGLIAGGMYVFGVSTETFSGERISMDLSGNFYPKISSKEEYVLKIVNNEEVPLEDVELFINWPANSSGQGFSVGYVSSEIAPENESNDTFKLGRISSGEEVFFKFSVRFTGSSGKELTLPFLLNVKPEGFGNYFPVKIEKTFSVGDAAIELLIDGPSDVVSGDNFNLEFRLSGDDGSFGDVSKLFIKAKIPQEFIVAEQGSSQTGSEWNVAALPMVEGYYKAVLAGSFEGSSGQDLVFSAEVYKEGEERPIASVEKRIIVKSPEGFISIFASPAQGKKLQWGERVDYSVKIENTGEYAMRDVVVSVFIEGEDFWDEDTISIGSGGFFEAGRFIWDSESNNSLLSIMPSNSVSLNFSFKTKKSPPKLMPGPPVLSSQASAVCEINAKEISIKSQQIKTNVLSDVSFDISGWYKNPEGLIVGSGPNPPIKGKETVYEIEFKLGPTTSELKDLELSMSAKDVISWKNESSSPYGEIVFDAGSKTVFWRAAKISALDIPISIKFKIGVSPQETAPDSLVLFDKIKFVAKDSAASENLEFFDQDFTLGDIE